MCSRCGEFLNVGQSVSACAAGIKEAKHVLFDQAMPNLQVTRSSGNPTCWSSTRLAP